MSGQVPRDAKRGLWFNLTVDAASDLGRDTDRIGVLVTAKAQQDERGAAAATVAAEILIMDRSLSMHREGKLHHAKHAIEAAIDSLADGIHFAVIAGNHAAEQVYPGGGRMERVSARTKTEAKARVSALAAVGGTAMGTWLALAGEIFGPVPDAVRHAVLYTDGINEHETPEQLGSALRACRDHFVCDVRGVGDDWDHRELRRIAGALQGTAEAIIDVTDLREDFIRLMEHAQRLVVPQTCLRLTLDRRFRLEAVRQIRPTANDLTGHGVPQDGGVVDIPLLAWGEETRDYLVKLRVDPDTLPYGDEVRAARVDMVAGHRGSQARVPCAAPAAVTVRRQRYQGSGPPIVSVGQAEDLIRLDEAAQAGIGAYQRGDRDTALRELTIAVGIALRLGASAHLANLRRLVTIDEYQKVALRPDIGSAALRTTAVRTMDNREVRPPARVPGPRKAGPGSAAVHQPAAGDNLIRRVCPRGHETVAPVVKYCEEPGCGHEFSDDPDHTRPPA
jgi:Ca-activated chloride channel family protein